MSQNPFTKIMAKKSSDELKAILNNQPSYDELAVAAVAAELRNRGESDEQTEQLHSELSAKLDAEQDEKEFNDLFISKNLIIALSLLLSPLLIAPFMSYNVWNLGDRRGIWSILFTGLMYFPYIYIISFLTSNYGVQALVLSIFHLLYVGVFVELAWKKYLPTYERYKKDKA